MLAGAPAEAAAGNGGAGAETEAAAEPGPAPEARAAAQPQRPAPEADDDGGLDALSIGASVAADRLRDPRVLLGSFAIVLLIGWLLGRRSG
jgi:hypothetical protein